MTPKSLLRHPEAVSTFDDLATGAFREVLGDTQVEPSWESRLAHVIVSPGKVYFELLERRRTPSAADTPLIRMEQMYPFPAPQLATELVRYPNLKTVVWAQEEAGNQGAWRFVEPQLREMLAAGAQLRYAGPSASESTAPGYHSAYVARQAAVISSAFAQYCACVSRHGCTEDFSRPGTNNAPGRRSLIALKSGARQSRRIGPDAAHLGP